MINIKLTSIIFSLFLLTGFTGCQKSLDVKPTSTIEKQSIVTKEDISVSMIMGSDEYMQGEEAYFEAYVLQSSSPVDCGKFTLQKYNDKTAAWENVKGAINLSVKSPVYIIKSVKTSDAGNYRWQYISPGSCRFNSTFSGSLYMNVI